MYGEYAVKQAYAQAHLPQQGSFTVQHVDLVAPWFFPYMPST